MGVLTEVVIDLLPFDHSRAHRVKDGKTKWDRAFSTRNNGESVLVKSIYKHVLTASLHTYAHHGSTEVNTYIRIHISHVGALVGEQGQTI